MIVGEGKASDMSQPESLAEGLKAGDIFIADRGYVDFSSFFAGGSRCVCPVRSVYTQADGKLQTNFRRGQRPNAFLSSGVITPASTCLSR